MCKTQMNVLVDTFSSKLGDEQQKLYLEYKSLIEALYGRFDVRALICIENDLIYLMSEVKDAIENSTEAIRMMRKSNLTNLKEYVIEE